MSSKNNPLFMQLLVAPLLLFHTLHQSFRAKRGILFFTVITSFTNLVCAQNDPLIKRVNSIAAQKEPLENVLTYITKQTGVRFSYNSQLIDPRTKVTVNAQNKTVKEVLTIILPASVSFKKVGEHIVFFAEKQHPLNPYFIKTPLVAEAQKEISFSNNGKPTDSCLDSVSFTKKEEMKTFFTELMLVAAMAATPVLAQDSLPVTRDTLQITRYTLIENENLITSVADSIVVDALSVPLVVKPIQVTFFYPLGTGWVKSAEKNYHVSLNILGGVTGQTIGIDLGGLFNINKYGARGVQFAGLFNSTGSNCSEVRSRNAQFAGIFNLTLRGESAQFGGIFNLGETAWVQAGGIFNIAQKASAQFGGIFNVAIEKSGAQFAGIFNSGCKAPFQAAGIVNIACKTAFQAAGIVNVAEKSACQIAGIVNVTKKGKFQMGLINVRDTADGVSLGLINIVKKGGILEAGIEAGEFVHTALTFRSGVPRLYSVIFVGCNYKEFWTVGTGLGTSVTLVKNLSINFELTHAQFYRKAFRYEHSAGTAKVWNSFCQFRPVLNYRFTKHFKMFLGPTFNLLIQNDFRPLEGYDNTLKVPYSFYNRTQNNAILDMWVGVVGGIKF